MNATLLHPGSPHVSESRVVGVVDSEVGKRKGVGDGKSVFKLDSRIS